MIPFVRPFRWHTYGWESHPSISSLREYNCPAWLGFDWLSYRGSIRSVASAAGTPATAFDRHAVYQILGHLRLAVVVSLAFTRFANPKLPLLNTIDAQGNISPSHPGLPGVPANIMGVRDHNLSLVFFLSSPLHHLSPPPFTIPSLHDYGGIDAHRTHDTRAGRCPASHRSGPGPCPSCCYRLQVEGHTYRRRSLQQTQWT